MIGLLDDHAALAARPADVVVYHPKPLGGPYVAEKLGVPAFAGLLIPLYAPTSAFPSPIFPVRPPGPLNRATRGSPPRELGVSIVPESVARLRCGDVVFRPLSPLTRVVTLDLTWRTGDSNPVVHNFRALFPPPPAPA
ncbi:hypothetical protein [Nonomuraea sp. NPDC049625]|uniref:hypothetical protein n=1 Tax=Nonomuraea sp. NPDC049625 TaxID=3155775 RepID=UPI003433EB53